MKKFVVSLLVTTMLSGCALSQSIPATTTVSLQQSAYAAKLGFNAALIVAVAYIELPRCDKPTSPVICSKQAVVDVARNSIKAADAATQAAEDAARSLNADSTVVSALITAAEKTVTALQTITPAKK